MSKSEDCVKSDSIEQVKQPEKTEQSKGKCVEAFPEPVNENQKEDIQIEHIQSTTLRKDDVVHDGFVDSKPQEANSNVGISKGGASQTTQSGFSMKDMQMRQGETTDDFVNRLKEQGIEVEEVGEILKEKAVFDEARKKLQDLIRQEKGIEISDLNLDEIIDQVDKSCMEEIIETKMRIEWERVFLKYFDVIRIKVDKFKSVKIDLENSKIVILEDKSSDYELKYEDKEVEETMNRYGNKKIGRGLHSRCILEMLIYNDIKKSLTDGMNSDEVFSKYTRDKVGEVWINYGENGRVMEYREGVIYAFLAILEAHNLGIKDIEEGINGKEEEKEKVSENFK